MAEVLLEVKNLVKQFGARKAFLEPARRPVRAVDGISFSVRRLETFGLVGESGCGKSTTGFCIARVYDPTAGEVYFEGMDILKLGAMEMRGIRRHIQMVFQDPHSSLDPRMTVLKSVGAPLLIHGLATRRDVREKVLRLLEMVGLGAQHLDRYPHQFSGGQKQRLGIARALALNPKLVILDEPTSALDVSVQAQILNLLRRLQSELGLSYIFISHNLGVVRYLSHRTAVMYLGKIVELGPTPVLFARPRHPYTRALLSAIPVPNPRHDGAEIILKGDLPSPSQPPSGCRFHTRCDAASALCAEKEPDLREVGEDHLVACHAPL